MNDLPSVVRAGALVAALMSLEGEVIPVSGDTPKLEVHWDGGEENAPGVQESFSLQAERNGVTYTVTLETIENDTRLPINAVALSGSVTSTSTATGTLSVSALPVDVSADTALPEQIAPPLLPEQRALDAAAETNERLPHSAVALSGSASSTSGATGTLAVAGADISPDKDTDWVTTLSPPTDPLAPSLAAQEGEYNIVDGTVVVVGDAPPGEEEPYLAPPPEPPPLLPVEELPVAPVALSGSAASTSGASGTLNVSAVPVDVSGDTAVAQSILPASDPLTPALQAEQDAQIPIKPVALSGTAASTSTAVGALSVAGVTIEPTDWSPHYGPDLDATSAILAAQEGEVIPVSGAVEGPGDAPPPTDDSADVAILLSPPQWHGPYPEHELPINPRPLTGSASSTSTATGTLSKAGTTLDVSGDTAVPERLAPPQDGFTPGRMAEDAQQIPIKPAALSGNAASTSTATGTISIGGTTLDVADDTAWVANLPPPSDPVTPAQAAADAEVIPVDGTIDQVAGSVAITDRAAFGLSISDRSAFGLTITDRAAFGALTINDRRP